MNADSEELSRYRKALASHSVVGAGGACPRPERIWEAARGGLGPREVAELADHTLACSDCALAWQLVVELGPAPDQPVRAQRTSSVLRHRQLWGGVMAAAAAVLLAVTIPWQDVGDRPPSGTRGGQQSEVGEISSLVPRDEPLSRQDCVLSWSSPWADATYSIRVLDERYKHVAEASGLTLPEYQVPAENLIGLGPNTSLTWYVEATAPDGTSLGEQSFTSTLE